MYVSIKAQMFSVPMRSHWCTLSLNLLKISNGLFISLLLFTVGIVYSKMGSNINVIISILFDGENISFEATLVMYINSTNIPPIIIMYRIYENQNFLYNFPLIRHTIVVCVSSISPMAKGSFICVNINLVMVLIDISNFVTSGDIFFFNVSFGD